MVSLEECVNLECNSLETYVKESAESRERHYKSSNNFMKILHAKPVERSIRSKAITWTV